VTFRCHQTVIKAKWLELKKPSRKTVKKENKVKQTKKKEYELRMAKDKKTKLG